MRYNSVVLAFKWIFISSNNSYARKKNQANSEENSRQSG